MRFMPAVALSDPRPVAVPFAPGLDGVEGPGENGKPGFVQGLVRSTTENTKPRGAARRFIVLEHRNLTEQVIGLAIEVHRGVGPALLESVHEECLCLELERAGIAFERQVMVPIVYKGTTIPLGFHADVVVANAIILEIKAVASLLPAHDAQLLTYLRMSEPRVGLLMNFHAPRLKDGLRRFIV